MLSKQGAATHKVIITPVFEAGEATSMNNLFSHSYPKKPLTLHPTMHHT